LESLLDPLVQTELVRTLRFSRWHYAAANTAHVIGIALLFGAIVSLDLRLLGAWRAIPHTVLARVLVPVAASGLALAVTAGALLFLVRAGDYLALQIFWAKMALIAVGTGHALWVHLGPGLSALSPGGQRRAGAISLTVWLSAVICGRLIAFSGY
jgi:hypothetical protein